MEFININIAYLKWTMKNFPSWPHDDLTFTQEQFLQSRFKMCESIIVIFMFSETIILLTLHKN